MIEMGDKIFGKEKNMEKRLQIKEFVVEHQNKPVGIDCEKPRFGWKLCSTQKNVMQSAYRICVYKDGNLEGDTEKVETEESIEVEIPGWRTKPMTEYQVHVTVWDNYGNCESAETTFETGRLGIPFHSVWIEPEQVPTPNSWIGKEMNAENVSENKYKGTLRDFKEFQKAQYIRIPFEVKKQIQKARVYVTAHGVYRLYVNGIRPDNREFAPENTSYYHILQYQTYDVTDFLKEGKNVFGIILGDGWWAGRVGVSGDSCQYGDKLGLLLEAVIGYADGTEEIITGEPGVSSTGPIIFSDLFVGEKYDARKELDGWNQPDYEDGDWKPVKKAEYPMDNLVGQYDPPVRIGKSFHPAEIFYSPKGECILDVGQVVAGQVEFTLDAPEGMQLILEHTEILDEQGNFFHNILGSNKEQTIFYTTKKGKQTYRPHFTYHGFRYVRITGWPGAISRENFKIHILTSEMQDLGTFETSDQRINRLQKNIWWSQVANTISIPTDCPQREKAGWTGDIMAYTPTLCFLRNADAFLTKWMANVRADQQQDGAIPMIVPFLKAYEIFVKASTGSITSCGWGDAVIMVPYGVYEVYGDKRILEENYPAMKKWIHYIQNRAEQVHPKEYQSWDQAHKERSRYLWNTDFHYGDWLIPSLVLNNPDGSAMMETAYATMGIVAPAYYAFSARMMARVAQVLEKTEDEVYYQELYEKIRSAFMEEYVREDGTIEGAFQGIYVIALKNDLVPESIRPKMVEHLCNMIQENQECLDTGFLSILFLMDVLCENGRRDVAYQLMFQTKCPSWLYEVEKGATTMWESWGAVAEDGTVSTYSYNHYAFGCVGEWMYRELGGLQAAAPGYKKIRIAPAVDCGLDWARVKEETPYGTAGVFWKKEKGILYLEVEIPANTTAEIVLPGQKIRRLGSGSYCFSVSEARGKGGKE